MSDSKKDNKDFKTAPRDARFANQNVTKYCYCMFVDHERCTRLLGDGYAGCKHFKDTYTSLCPNAWIERWKQQIEDGTFPIDFPEKKK